MEQQVLDQTKPMMDLGENLSYCALIQNYLPNVKESLEFFCELN
jgi:hypothetical protein